MRIWLITVGEPLPLPGRTDKAMRTGRLASYLCAKGNEVVWWSSTFDHFRKRHYFDGSRDLTVDDGVELKLLDAPRYGSNVSLTRLRHLRITAQEFERKVLEMPVPDIILCSYPTIELCAAAVRYARRAGCKVIVDIRDLWPDIFLDVLPRSLRPLAIPAVWLYDRMGRQALRGADGIVAISSDYLEWGLSKAGRHRGHTDAVFPIGFSTTQIADRALATAREHLSAHGVRFDKKLAVFIGSFGRTYDLSTVIRAAARLEQTQPDLQFVLAGDGERIGQWRNEAKGLSNVVMPGWIDIHQSIALCSASCIGLQSYSAGAPQGLPNKLFEYLGFGMAVVSSLEGESEALLTQHRCGLNYPAGRPEVLATRLAELVISEQRLAEFRRNARDLFEREFSIPLIHERFLVYLQQQLV